MNRIKKILQDAINRSDKAGGALSANSLAGLERHRRRQFTIFILVEVFVVLAVAACAWFLVTHPGETAAMKAFAALIGLGSGGGLEIGRRTWKEWARADLLIVMLSAASESQVKTVIDRLLKTL